MANAHPMLMKQIPDLQTLQTGWPALKGVLFDMDGTLFDTEKYHTQAFLKIGRDHKILPPHSAEIIHGLLVGRADHLVFEVVRHWQGFPKDWTARDFVNAKNQNLLSILRNIPTEDFLPDSMISLLAEIKKNQLSLALVTSSERVVTEELLRMGKVDSFFDLVITRDDCPVHKPDPWPYKKALELLKLSPFEALVFEDSEVGVTAATGSGAHVVKVDWHVTA